MSNHTSYTPELQDKPTDYDFMSSISYSGKHWILTQNRAHDEAIELSGRGVTPWDDGMFKVTERAYNKICAEFNVVWKHHLQ